MSQIFDAIPHCKRVSVANSNLFSMRNGKFLSSFLVSKTKLVEVDFVNSIQTQQVGKELADGLMRSK